MRTNSCPPRTCNTVPTARGEKSTCHHQWDAPHRPPQMPPPPRKPVSVHGTTRQRSVHSPTPTSRLRTGTSSKQPERHDHCPRIRSFPMDRLESMAAWKVSSRTRAIGGGPQKPAAFQSEPNHRQEGHHSTDDVEGQFIRRLDPDDQQEQATTTDPTRRQRTKPNAQLPRTKPRPGPAAPKTPAATGRT